MIELAEEPHVMIGRFAQETVIAHARMILERKQRGEATQEEVDAAFAAADRAIGQMIDVMPDDQRRLGR